MSEPTPIKIANQLEHKSDRWLFIFALVILIGGGVSVIHYLVGRADQATKLYQETMQKTIADQNETVKALAICIDRNTTALNDCRDELAACRKQRQ